GGGSSIDNADDDGPVLASDGAGNWVLLWRRNQVLGKVLAAASPDNGASWGSLAELRSGLGGAGTLAGFTGGRYAALATDRLGTWIADWNDGCAKSIDAGATWTIPLACPFGDLWRLEGAATSGVLLADGNGAWLSAAAYLDPVTLGGSVGSDADILISRSVDGGVTWSHPAALVGTAARGRAWKDLDSDPVLAVDANGQWMAAWISGEPSLSGSDGDPLTGDTDIVVARAVPVCRPDPVANCTTVRAADKQRFKLVARGGNGDRLALALRSKDLIPGDFGDPTGTTDIGLCVYDRVAGITRLVYEINVPASATCGGVPCWAGAAGRFDYIDRTSRHGAVTRVKLRARGGGGGAVTIKGHGPALAPPRIPFIVDPDLTVQVVAADTRTCLEAHFSSPKRNNDETFRAK
ncbi:MAG: exo-alpha-sialidase, partial [Candidatus Dadabacteria bacterium]